MDRTTLDRRRHVVLGPCSLIERQRTVPGDHEARAPERRHRLRRGSPPAVLEDDPAGRREDRGGRAQDAVEILLIIGWIEEDKIEPGGLRPARPPLAVARRGPAARLRSGGLTL